MQIENLEIYLISGKEVLIKEKKTLKIYLKRHKGTAIEYKNQDIEFTIKEKEIIINRNVKYNLCKSIEIKIQKMEEPKILCKIIEPFKFVIDIYFLNLIFDIRRVPKFFTNQFLKIIEYLVDDPIGIKQNKLIKLYFAKFYEAIFNLQLFILDHEIGMYLPPTFWFWHIKLCNMALCKIFSFTFSILTELISIFRGKNYNKIKYRMDDVQYSPETIILASIFFAFVLLILYNIIGFYILSKMSFIIKAMDFVFLYALNQRSGICGRNRAKSLVFESEDLKIYRLKKNEMCI